MEDDRFENEESFVRDVLKQLAERLAKRKDLSEVVSSEVRACAGSGCALAADLNDSNDLGVQENRRADHLLDGFGGFGVDFALAVQGLDQLKDHYGEAKNTILSNCAYQWFCNLNDLDSAKYLSEVLGKKTVVTETTSDSTSSGGRGGSTSHSVSHGETARALLNPDEVLNLGKDVAILIQPKGHPHYLRPVDYWNLPRAFSSLREKRCHASTGSA